MRKWYQYWLDNGFCQSQTAVSRILIVIPPLTSPAYCTWDICLTTRSKISLVRRAQGWVRTLAGTGTDHASIATEAKVVNRLAGQGIKKTDLTRDEFLRHAWGMERRKKWRIICTNFVNCVLPAIGIVRRSRWTRTFERYVAFWSTSYGKGLIYWVSSMVNWDPKALTALSG